MQHCLNKKFWERRHHRGMISVEYFASASSPLTKKQIQAIAECAARREKKIRGAIEVSMVSESKIKKINKEYRGKDAVTDVLSFSWVEGGKIPGELLGEMYICYPQIKRQAKELFIPHKEEFARMLVHGLLHIVGYDHVREVDSKKMFKLQEQIVEEVKKKKII